MEREKAMWITSDAREILIKLILPIHCLGNRSSIHLSYEVIRTYFNSKWHLIQSHVCTIFTQIHTNSPKFTFGGREKHGKMVFKFSPKKRIGKQISFHFLRILNFITLFFILGAGNGKNQY